jgi:hypothetical protein
MTKPGLTDEERFWIKVGRTDDPDECWEWKASIGDVGYGIFHIRDEFGKWKAERAHRMAWILTYGHPGELFVLHRCDNRKCANPNHLFLGTNQDNMKDMVAKGRRLRGYKKLSAEVCREIAEWRKRGETLSVISAAFNIKKQTIKGVVRRAKQAGELPDANGSRKVSEFFGDTPSPTEESV